MASLPLSTLSDGPCCPRCYSPDVLQFCVLRSSVVYLCDACSHRWEVFVSDAGVGADAVTVRVTVSTGYGADHHRLTRH